MPYYVEIAESVQAHLAAVEGMADEARAIVLDGTIAELSSDADRFLKLYPLGRESLHFRYDYSHPDGSTLFSFDFIVDGTEMPSGVVRVVYVEHRTDPIP